jgi:hypothetical protein
VKLLGRLANFGSTLWILPFRCGPLACRSEGDPGSPPCGALWVGAELTPTLMSEAGSIRSYRYSYYKVFVFVIVLLSPSADLRQARRRDTRHSGARQQADAGGFGCLGIR